MSNEELRAIISVAGYQVVGGTILDLADCEDVLTYQPKEKGYLFAAIKLKNGKAAALWETHAVVADSLEVLFGDAEHDAMLNHHERLLLTYGAKR